MTVEDIAADLRMFYENGTDVEDQVRKWIKVGIEKQSIYEAYSELYSNGIIKVKTGKSFEDGFAISGDGKVHVIFPSTFEI